MEYSEQFKEAAVEKFLLRGSKGASEICRDLGISTAAIYRWSRKCGRTPKMNEPRGPQDLSLEQKYKAVFEYEKLAEEKRGEFLRREGLHSDHLVKWEKEIQDCFINRDSEASITRAERAKWNQNTWTGLRADKSRMRSMTREFQSEPLLQWRDQISLREWEIYEGF